jgi:hypothetical protein
MGPGGGFVLMWPVAAFVIGYLYERALGTLTFTASPGRNQAEPSAALARSTRATAAIHGMPTA